MTHIDPILAEIWRVRDEHARKFNYDVRAIFEDIQREEAASGRRYVSYPPRPLQDVEPAPPPRKTG